MIVGMPVVATVTTAARKGQTISNQGRAVAVVIDRGLRGLFGGSVLGSSEAGTANWGLGCL